MPFELGHAEELITDKTVCEVAVPSPDKADAENMAPLVIYIENSFDAMDSAHTEAGEPGIMAGLLDKGLTKMAILAVVHCRSNPKSTVYNFAAFVYRGYRDFQIEMGTAK